MTTIIYPTNARNTKIHANKLVSELPMRLEEFRQIPEVNYALILSSLLITIALMSLAWLLSANMSQSLIKASPWDEIATSPANGVSYSGLKVTDAMLNR